MTSRAREIRTEPIAVGSHLRVREALGTTLKCCAGTVWITQEGDRRDIFLRTGESFTFDRPGLAVVSAERGISDEWLDDMDFVVVCLTWEPGTGARIVRDAT